MHFWKHSKGPLFLDASVRCISNYQSRPHQNNPNAVENFTNKQISSYQKKSYQKCTWRHTKKPNQVSNLEKLVTLSTVNSNLGKMIKSERSIPTKNMQPYEFVHSHKQQCTVPSVAVQKIEEDGLWMASRKLGESRKTQKPNNREVQQK